MERPKRKPSWRVNGETTAPKVKSVTDADRIASEIANNHGNVTGMKTVLY